MPFLIFVTSADSSCPLDRVDYTSLSQQALMEMFIENVYTDENFVDDAENYTEIDEWDGLEFNDDGEVTAIDFFQVIGPGILDFEAIPSTVTYVSLVVCESECEVPWDKFSDGLEYFILFESAFHGTIDLTSLPSNLFVLTCGNCAFSGTLDFSKLPKNLVLLNLSGNALAGQIDLREIEKTMCELSYEHQEIEHERVVPRKDLDFALLLRRNKFEGDVRVKALDLVGDYGQFGSNECRVMVDENGRKREIRGQDGVWWE
eukprot:CAMPEP_0201520642 /NCGR_PEP_ID=MMETSP0161_2-20130828/12012_1 /ASSEMBLY_ACC=CAM_ASM_000251 /TAXON_ID=180227 /ORGANISM="Neoparamoeba aestuarina, Strain SoJaBio B1-5/56/2" /LENGTH=259 /DNA_ID=CAMNT_0047919093 /DNA_START=33 /DNA_END=812 /DNA_ORIENTATION=+